MPASQITARETRCRCFIIFTRLRHFVYRFGEFNYYTLIAPKECFHLQRPHWRNQHAQIITEPLPDCLSLFFTFPFSSQRPHNIWLKCWQLGGSIRYVIPHVRLYVSALCGDESSTPFLRPSVSQPNPLSQVWRKTHLNHLRKIETISMLIFGFGYNT